MAGRGCGALAGAAPGSARPHGHRLHHALRGHKPLVLPRHQAADAGPRPVRGEPLNLRSPPALLP